MKIFDCFTFFNELEILELRFMELYDTVDYFVIAEANRSHNGTPKEFVFEKNKDRYEKKYLDKVIYVKVEDMPEYDTNEIFKLEYFQRNAIMRGLEGMAKEGDKILLSDLDEIPNIEAIKVNLNVNRWLLFKQSFFYYYFNCKMGKDWGGTVMADWGSFKRPQQLRAFAKRHSWEKSGESVYLNGGWHYSYATGGDPEKVKEKINLFAESSFLSEIAGTPEKIKERMDNQIDLYDREKIKRTHIQEIVDISNNKPRMLDKFLEKYPNFIYRGEAKPKHRRIFDCFTFFNEFELLELRFMELYDTVDYFVLVEANKCHNGTPKEFLFEKNKHRYEKKYLDKLIHVKVEDMPEQDKENLQNLEFFQRKCIMRGLKSVARESDKILVSDVDEIPNVETIKANMDSKGWLLFKQTLFYYYVNCRAERGWGGTVMADWGSFRDAQQLRRFATRHSWAKPCEGLCLNGGWHYSYATGGNSKQEDLYDRENKKAGYKFEIIDISNDKPRMLDKFLEKYPNFIYKSKNENNRKMKNYEWETQEHSTLGDKMLQHCDVLYDIQVQKKWRPVTFQLAPTGACDFNCEFCSVTNRDKTLALPFNWIEKALKDFKNLGAKALEISGGGNPLLYPQINEVVDLAHRLGYDIGIISNSMHPGKYLTKESAGKLTWYRASLSAYDNFPAEAIKYDFGVIPEGKLSFSYIINSETKKEYLENIAKLVKERPDIKFVRIAPNCSDKHTLENFKKDWSELVQSIDPDNKFFFKEISDHYKPYPDYCAVGMIRPYVCEDGNIYACSSFLLRKRKLEPEWIIGHITDVPGMYERANKLYGEKGIPYEVPIDKCFHCLLYNNNKFLHNVVRKMEDGNFA